mmetsp:Transcript_19709/g.55044  ORF Transcript_19709/g.55044 Transcript_19709/m.55044 type:complete len:133 (+) Transcript_19709:454-852(+)|eukprot:CAMPEP_0172362074 /NCGR_PEP_ID=MMETSP1060-20121228/5775_1 /TAXON_ID=37318 /ORGANISM="Pseudo-nitzschia pungens, Strain cf. cingulata" /LENGTH=132 /DNA_ID=CAMNT_0013084497 /DNA_START=400 /DNA_END=798 /DNA_ORIENTATION=-
MITSVETVINAWNMLELVFVSAIVWSFYHFRSRRKNSAKLENLAATDRIVGETDLAGNERARTGGRGWIHNDLFLPAEGIFGDDLHRNDYGNDQDDHGTVIDRQEIVEITFDLGEMEEKLRRFLCRMNRIMT